MNADQIQAIGIAFGMSTFYPSLAWIVVTVIKAASARGILRESIRAQHTTTATQR